MIPTDSGTLKCHRWWETSITSIRQTDAPWASVWRIHIPSGTGLASSSAFTVGLLHTIGAYTGKFRSQEELAEEACDMEINKLGEPIGKQDQYGCAVGGLKFIRFMSCSFSSRHVERSRDIP